MNVGVFVVDDVADFGLAAILEVFGTADGLRAELDRSMPPWVVQTLGLGSAVRSGAGHTVPTVPVDDLAACPDLLIVPALNVKAADALIDTVSARDVEPALRLIRQVREAGTPVAAACTGTFFLAEAGILDGVPATTSWWLAPAFRGRYPRVLLEQGRTVCRSGGITTAGAAVAHLDLAVALVQAQSPALAELVSRFLLIGRGPQSAFAIPSVLARHDPTVAAFERWVRSNLDRPIQIAAAAAALGMSERSLQRITSANLGMRPLDFVHEIRLDHATHLLRTTALSADAVATAVGYLNASTLRDLVRRRRGMTLRELRHALAGPEGPASPKP
jgi:transcriptional regulator GlxA family with amidase domain